MPTTLHALDFLSEPAKHPAAPVCVCFGDERFLKRLALSELRRQVLGDDDGEFSETVFEGKQAAPRDVFDELSTHALFGGGRRLVLIQDADEFVSAHRSLLEDYAARPAATGVLVLDAKSWPSNTRLAKAVASSGLTIDCSPPPPAKLQKWLTAWAKKQHRVKLEPAGAELLVDLVGPELGLLDQELAKLAAFAGSEAVVTAAMVEDLVGGWKAKTIWDLLDAAAAGNAREALQQLDHLLLAGESPVGLLGMIGSSLRRYAAAARLVQEAQSAGRRTTLRQALQDAGIKPFVLNKAEVQLRQLGSRRASQLYRWLLETDLALKGASAQPPRTLLETLIVRMSREAGEPAKTR